MRLVIAEKPSVAMSIAKVLGAGSRKGGHMEGGGWLVSWCVGHLVGLAPADAYDPRYSKWTCADLPIIPDPWQFQVLPDTREQFDVLRRLMGREDVDMVVCATDAGREGELIFRLTYDLCRCTKPVKRLWISSMEESAIRKGFDALADGRRYDALYDAALCRAKADWLIGINGTRLFTCLYKGKTLNVGRVLTPTLALLAEREAAIEHFKKEKSYTVELDAQGLRAASGKFSSRTDAERLRSACLGKTAVVQSVTRRDKAEAPPKLYDLTTLQREANRLFGYTAQQKSVPPHKDESCGGHCANGRAEVQRYVWQVPLHGRDHRRTGDHFCHRHTYLQQYRRTVHHDALSPVRHAGKERPPPF